MPPREVKIIILLLLVLLSLVLLLLLLLQHHYYTTTTNTTTTTTTTTTTNIDIEARYETEVPPKPWIAPNYTGFRVYWINARDPHTLGVWDSLCLCKKDPVFFLG